jgi:Leucine-rich repeat (LRR) protein
VNESIFNLGWYLFSLFSFSFPRTDVARNRLAKISGKAFINLSNLTYLDISYNKLSALELDYMCHLPKLQTLNISGNVQMNLLDVRPVFQNLTELRALSIADITSMPLGIFVPLANLQMLNISGTHLNNETLQILNPLAKLKVSFVNGDGKELLAF